MEFSLIIPRALKFIIFTLLINIFIIINIRIILILIIFIIVINIFIIFDISKESSALNTFFKSNDPTAVKDIILFKIFINFYIN